MKKILKKYLFIILSCIIMLGITGCSDEVTDSEGMVQQNNSQYLESSENLDESEENEGIDDYVEDSRIQVPKASSDCEGVSYIEVVDMFQKAGFTDVKVYGTEIEHTTEVADKTVVMVSVDGRELFDKNAKFEKDSEVKIVYYVILPEPVQSEQQDVTNVDTNNDGSNSQEMVWIPKTGKKYHSKSSCSNMKNPSQVTKEEAEDMGYEPCKKCY